MAFSPSKFPLFCLYSKITLLQKIPVKPLYRKTTLRRVNRFKKKIIMLQDSYFKSYIFLIIHNPTGFRCFQHLNPVDPLHNCMFDNNELCLQNVFAKNNFAMFRKAPEVGNIICIFL